MHHWVREESNRQAHLASQILIMLITGGLSLGLVALIGSSLPGADGDDRYMEQWQNRLTGVKRNILRGFFFFYVLLTVHLSIILVINQLNAQNLVL